MSLVLWTGDVDLFVRVGLHHARVFHRRAAIVAIVMGGSQALSRSLFAQLIPPGKEAEYFSIYEVSDKGTSWLSPLVFGLGAADHAQLPAGDFIADRIFYRGISGADESGREREAGEREVWERTPSPALSRASSAAEF